MQTVEVRAGGELPLPFGSSFVYYRLTMPSSKKVIPKKRGRPAKGRDPVMTLRAPPDLSARLERYAKKRGVSRSQAARDLIASGLERDL